MPENDQSPTAPPGCAPTTGSEVPTPRTDKETWTTIAGAFKCSGANGDLEGEGEYVPTAFARQLEREAVTLADSHRTLLHESMEMSDELAWAKQTASDALRERDEARTRAKDYFDALELAAKERDDWRKCAAWLESHVIPHSDDCGTNRFAPGDKRRTMEKCNCDQGLACAEFERLKRRAAGLPNEKAH